MDVEEQIIIVHWINWCI